jgi:hypothetical protein
VAIKYPKHESESTENKNYISDHKNNMSGINYGIGDFKASNDINKEDIEYL